MNLFWTNFETTDVTPSAQNVTCPSGTRMVRAAGTQESSYA